MKTLLFLYALLQLLAGCAKDDSKAGTAGVNATPSCPSLAGTYKGTDPDDNSALAFTFDTRRNGASTSYYIGDEAPNANSYYQTADGSALTGTSDQGAYSRTMICSSNSLTIKTKNGNDPEFSMTFTDIGNRQIRVESGSHVTVLTKG